jgi:hypothetical protein
MKPYLGTFLADKFKPKTADEIKKVKSLEKLLVRYVLVRFLEEMSEPEFKKLKRQKFESTVKATDFFKQEIPDFDRKLQQYRDEFLKKYG